MSETQNSKNYDLDERTLIVFGFENLDFELI